MFSLRENAPKTPTWVGLDAEEADTYEVLSKKKVRSVHFESLCHAWPVVWTAHFSKCDFWTQLVVLRKQKKRIKKINFSWRNLDLKISEW